VLYDELIGFDLIPAGIRFKQLQVGIKTATFVNSKDTALGIDEPSCTEMVLHIPRIVFA
jgi:hypothetical protein